MVSRSPLRTLWGLHGTAISVIAKRTWRSVFADNLFGRAAELGFYFLFALFPTIFSASSILGLIARSASQIYEDLLGYLSLIMPMEALGSVMMIFRETTEASGSGKITFGLIATIWSASVGISAIQDTLNAVYKVQETRSYIKARLSAIAVTIILTVIGTLCLASMLGADFFAAVAYHRIQDRFLAQGAVIAIRVIGWTIAIVFLSLSFAVIYYWAPAVKKHRWHWLTVGGAVGIAGWLLASLGLRIYLHFFNNYSVIYGSLGAVIILLTWFYITGLMILLGAEINSEIEAAAAEKRLTGKTFPRAATA
jgi:membrane protein